MSQIRPDRGDIWLVNLNPTLGHEQQGIRPCLVISVNPLNHGPAEIAIVLPITSVKKGIPSHVLITPPEGGLKSPSYVKCEDMRSVSTAARFVERWGRVGETTMLAVESRLRLLLGL
jgi:mRNA interferase MazF